jgi:hypothetical protein
MRIEPPAVTPVAVEQVAAMLDVPLPPDTYEQVARVLEVLLESARALDGVSLDGSELAGSFDARWDL